ncbi:hypothetical protein IKS73_09545, partial [bacterium]|nr:hypothetical protein [bacterium]
PVQLKTFQNKPVTFDMLQKMKSGALPFKSLPLDKTAIINIDQFVKNGSPTDNYKLYYFLRQSEAIYEYLSISDALPLVYLMRKSREQNRNFDKDYDNYFASLHRDSFMGKKTEPKKDDKKDKKDKDKKDKKEGDAEEGGDEAEAEDIGSNYKAFRNRIPSLVFSTLTADSVASDIEEQKKAKAQKGKEPTKDQKNQKKSKKD